MIQILKSKELSLVESETFGKKRSDRDYESQPNFTEQGCKEHTNKKKMYAVQGWKMDSQSIFCRH